VKIQAKIDSMKHGETVDDVVEHFGVKGMHWGVRKNRSSGEDHIARMRGEASADSNRAHNNQQRVHKTGVHALSNEDLQHLVNRINLEQQYSKLTSDPNSKNKVKRGRDFVDEQTKSGRSAINAIKTGKELAKLLAPIFVAAAAGAGAAAATGHTGPVRMPRLAIST
jgi:hypothetical protein